MQFEVGPAGESAMRLAYAESPHPGLTRGLLLIQELAERRFAGSLIDAVIGYTTLTLFFNGSQLERDRVEAWLCDQAANVALQDSALIGHSTPDVVLPVFYHPSVAPDLEWLADEKGLSIDDIITTHTQTTYFAYATGFAPGFCYLGTLPSQLATPRLATPRAQVPSGSVAIADSQTAVYPCDSPGGWRLIGACPKALFNLNDAPPSVLSVGMTVRFEPINEADFRLMTQGNS
jgi:KipI family sensor histidine kinase inhibitor